MKFLFPICLFLAMVLFAEEIPFSASLTWTQEADNQIAIAHFDGPENGHLTAEFIELVLPDGFNAELLDAPETDAEGYYPLDVVLRWRVTPKLISGEATLHFQGCVDMMCYLPQKLVVQIDGDTPEEPPTTPPAQNLVPDDAFRVSEPLFGYASADDFRKWLNRTQSGENAPEENLLERVFARYGWALAALLTIFLGILLNLTPCVLPMIPITLGVLGARGAGQGRGKGLALGGVYGLAMALTYGIAGAIVVALGGRVGAINSSPIFQFVLAVVFVLLALSMFDCFFLDFSRFRRQGSHPAGSYAAAAFLGIMAALMAGACIAPVLIWVLLLSAKLYAEGTTAALWLPLLLGVGLGLPWPFLGAGIGALPKPGNWMNYTKKAVGVVILLFAIYTAWNGLRLLQNSHGAKDDFWRADYQQCLADAQQTQTPILLDFWGVSCKACTMMDATTLRDKRVREELQKFICVSIQGDAGDGAQLAEKYKILGFPTYIVLTPTE